MLEERILQALELEERIEGAVFAGETLDQLYAEKVEFERVRFENCRFIKCDFTGAMFLEVVFENCDLSNCNMRQSYWKRAKLLSSKAQGTDFREVSFHQVEMRDSKLDYANMGRGLFDGVILIGNSFVSASIAEARWKKVKLQECRLISVDFFKTPLKGVDLSGCELGALSLSEDLRELKGAKIDALQAAEIARMLGILVV